MELWGRGLSAQSISCCEATVWLKPLWLVALATGRLSGMLLFSSDLWVPVPGLEGHVCISF